MTSKQMYLQLLDMLECAQGWISEDNDHPYPVPDSWLEAIRMASTACGVTDLSLLKQWEATGVKS